MHLNLDVEKQEAKDSYDYEATGLCKSINQ